MWARGNTSSEASLVECLCNSPVLVLICAATKGSSLFPSRMPPLVLVISSSFDMWVFWQADPKSTTLLCSPSAWEPNRLTSAKSCPVTF